MDATDFWALIDAARADCAADSQWARAEEIGDALADRLGDLEPNEIAAFEQLRSQLVWTAHSWELCAACFLISGHLSDDSFTDFANGLLALGQEAFERATADADSLALVPIVRAIAGGDVDRAALNGEEIMFAAQEAWAEATDADQDEDGLADALQELDDDEDELEPIGGWDGTFGPDDGPAIPSKLPKLSELFGYDPDLA